MRSKIFRHAYFVRRELIVMALRPEEYVSLIENDSLDIEHGIRMNFARKPAHPHRSRSICLSRNVSRSINVDRVRDAVKRAPISCLRAV